MKRKISIVFLVLALIFSLSTAAFAVNDEAHPKKYALDYAELLTSEEEQELEATLEEISERQQFDVVVLTVDSLEGKTAEEYADDYFDYNGYGQGADYDGCLLLLAMETREWHLSTSGYGITAITDYGIESISSSFLGDLSDGNYYDAFCSYAADVDTFVTQAKNGLSYDSYGDDNYAYGDGYEYQRTGRHFELTFLVFGLIAGLVTAAIVTSVMKSKLKSVAFKAEANDYLVQGSFVLTGQHDRFIRSDIVKTPIPSSSNSSHGGGSSTHTSSSGHTHGGGGGHF